MIMRRAFLVLLIAVTCLSALVTVKAQIGVGSNEKQKRKLLRKIQASNAAQIFSDNSQGSPLHIQEASVKEITGGDFTILAGEGPKNVRQTTFPEVTLFNSSQKTIRSFAIAVKSVADNRWHFLLKSDLSIARGSAHTIASSEWTMAERVFIQKGDKFVSRLRQPGLDSSKSWIPGAASDLRITVGMVEFEDGTRWMVSRDFDL